MSFLRGRRHIIDRHQLSKLIEPSRCFISTPIIIPTHYGCEGDWLVPYSISATITPIRRHGLEDKDLMSSAFQDLFHDISFTYSELMIRICVSETSPKAHTQKVRKNPSRAGSDGIVLMRERDRMSSSHHHRQNRNSSVGATVLPYGIDRIP